MLIEGWLEPGQTGPDLTWIAAAIAAARGPASPNDTRQHDARRNALLAHRHLIMRSHQLSSVTTTIDQLMPEQRSTAGAAEPVDRAAAHGPDAGGRERLLDTAERLFDERGIDGVSLRTLTAESGHRNASAVNYYFSGRNHLVQAVLVRRQETIETARRKLLDELESRGSVEPVEAIVATVQPISRLLETPEGRRYIRLLFQASVHPAFHDYSVAAYAPTVARTAVHALPLVEHLSPHRRVPRLRLGMRLALLAFAEQARLIDTANPTRPPVDNEQFVAELIEVIIGALTA